MPVPTIDQERLPRENLYRANFTGVNLRAEGEEGEGDSGPVMSGHFLVFDQWTEIKSCYEGNFLERFAPGSVKKTIRENREAMRVLFQHGFDYVVGDKPLGPIRTLEEDSVGDHVSGVAGAWYEVPLLDAGYVRDDVLPGLEADLYGASFRFRVIREEIDEEPGVSDHNPNGLPERTIKEAQVMEFGPVTFPAYAGASAGVRSLSDEFVLSRFAERPEHLRELLSHLPSEQAAEARSESDPCSHPEGEVDPDDPSLCEDCRTKAIAAREQRDQKLTDAPPEDSAEAQPHPDDGRRETPPFGGTEKRTPPWRQPSKRKAPWASADQE